MNGNDMFLSMVLGFLLLSIMRMALWHKKALGEVGGTLEKPVRGMTVLYADIKKYKGSVMAQSQMEDGDGKPIKHGNIYQNGKVVHMAGTYYLESPDKRSYNIIAGMEPFIQPDSLRKQGGLV